MTYWVDTPAAGVPFDVEVRFTGRRDGVKGKPRHEDSFDVVEDVRGVLPGSGPVSVTRRVRAINEGRWHVKASARRLDQSAHGGRSVKLPSSSTSGSTGYARVIGIRAPGAVIGAWPVLVSFGVLVAFGTQFALARRNDLPAPRLLMVSVVASLLGLVGAKLYYAVEHRGRGTKLLVAGMCIQGFVTGAIGTLVVGSLLVELAVGAVLDVTAPGLMLAMGTGRIGCFFGGCCAGRPTSSRWGLWSSDRRTGVRRLPAQLFESVLAFSLGFTALLAVAPGAKHGGAVFVAAIAAYVLGRQALFPLRILPRNTRHGRSVTTLLAAAVLVAAVSTMLS